MWWDNIDFLSTPDSVRYFLGIKECRKASYIAGALCVLGTVIFTIIFGEVDIVSVALNFMLSVCANLIGFFSTLSICKAIVKYRATKLIMSMSYAAELLHFQADEREHETREEVLTYIEALEKGRGRRWLFDGQLTGGF